MERTESKIKKVVVIMTDSFRRDCLPGMGKRRVLTPVLDEFAKGAVVFEKAYAASFPTVPNRADVMTGRHAYTYMGWEPLPRHLPVLAQELTNAGIITMSIQDTPVTIKQGFNFDRGFGGWQYIRGQDSDNNRTDYTTDPLLPCKPEKLRTGRRLERLHFLNAHFRRNERDTLVAQTMTSATDWLEANYKHDKFFLYVDTFDPHEPWDAPEFYLRLYEKPGYSGDNVSYPNYWKKSRYTPEEVAHCRNLYDAEVTLVDTWIGEVLRKIDTLGIAEETAVIIMSDHGFLFGEHNYVGKWGEDDDPLPIYDEVSGICMMARLPGRQFRHGERSEALVQPLDIMPTLMDLMGLKKPEYAQGFSMVPLVKKNGRNDWPRKIATTSGRLQAIGEKVLWSTGGYVSITDGEWTLMFGQSLLPSELYHTADDPKQLKNVIAKKKNVAMELHEQWVEHLKSLAVPPEILQSHSVRPQTGPMA